MVNQKQTMLRTNDLNDLHDRSSSWYLGVAWLLVMTCCVMALVRLDEFFKSERPVVALVKDKMGDVQSRPDGFYLWNTIKEGQQLVDGTVLATDTGSKARVIFRGGRALDVGPSSQIKITFDPSNPDSSPVVNLVKGTLRVPSLAHSGTGKGSSLSIQTDKSTVSVNSGQDDVYVSKTLGQSSVVKLMQGNATVLDQNSGEQFNLDSKSAGQMALDLEKLAAGQNLRDTTKLNSFAASKTDPERQFNAVDRMELLTLAAQPIALNVPVAAPTRVEATPRPTPAAVKAAVAPVVPAATDNSYMPFKVSVEDNAIWLLKNPASAAIPVHIKFSRQDVRETTQPLKVMTSWGPGEQTSVVDLESSKIHSGNVTFNIPSAVIAQALAAKSEQIKVMVGYANNDNAGELAAKYTESAQVQIRSTEYFNSQPALLLLDKLELKHDADQVIQDSKVSEMQANYRIYVSNGSLLESMKPYIASQSRFDVKRIDAVAPHLNGVNDAIYFFINGKKVSSVVVTKGQIPSNILSDLKKRLKSQAVLRGPANALIPRASVLHNFVQSKNPVYFFYNNQLVEVHASSLINQPHVLKSLEKLGFLAFSKPLEVINLGH